MWRLTSVEPVILRGWDDEYILYDRASGDTHQLTWLAAGLLLRLQVGPADQTMLARHVAAIDTMLEPEDVSARIAAAVTRFCDLGLLTPIAT